MQFLNFIVLSESTRGTVEKVHSRGCRHFEENLIPNIKRSVEKLTLNRKLDLQCHCFLFLSISKIYINMIRHQRQSPTGVVFSLNSRRI